jgi:4-hydroxybenzoate polyprenyltransferase
VVGVDLENKVQASVVSSSSLPLVIDLDGTLLKTDLLYESFFGAIAAGNAKPVCFACEFCRGRAALKQHLAGECTLDYATLPYDPEVLALVVRARKEGRNVYLATASHETHARAIADHLGIFDGVFASDGLVNLKGARKAAKLVECFGARGFEYCGNSSDDLPVWAQSARAYTIRTRPSVRNKLISIVSNVEHLATPYASARPWFKALRVHQYAKNLLLFVPMFTAHRFDLWTFFHALLGVVAFSLCASSVYLLNDLVDLKADRVHPSKRRRPFASGELPIKAGLFLIPVLFVLAVVVSAFISLNFILCLLGYFVLTTAYTFALKKKMIVDVIVLATLYTVRIIAGGIATDVVVSQWLLMFAIFVFTSLALMKRYVELSARLENNLPDPENRNYKTSDLHIVATLAAASGVNSVTIFALYLSSPAVAAAYSRPGALWLICPILLYWFARAVMMAHRRTMDDDPVVFALKDRVSLIAIVSIVALVLIAI